jgi:hypothetical protein
MSGKPDGGYSVVPEDLVNAQRIWKAEEAYVRGIGALLDAMKQDAWTAAQEAIDEAKRKGTAAKGKHRAAAQAEMNTKIKDINAAYKNAESAIAAARTAQDSLSRVLQADIGDLQQVAANYTRADAPPGPGSSSPDSSPGSTSGGSGGRHGGGALPPGAGSGKVATSAQVRKWIDEAIKILEANGVPAADINANDIALIIENESGGNPTIVNHWDSNAAAGTPSMGLMQTIQPTFDSYALPGHKNILNPVDNIIAGVRYAIARYGSVQNVPGVVAVHAGRAYVGY